MTKPTSQWARTASVIELMVDRSSFTLYVASQLPAFSAGLVLGLLRALGLLFGAARLFDRRDFARPCSSAFQLVVLVRRAASRTRSSALRSSRSVASASIRSSFSMRALTLRKLSPLWSAMRSISSSMSSSSISIFSTSAIFCRTKCSLSAAGRALDHVLFEQPAPALDLLVGHAGVLHLHDAPLAASCGPGGGAGPAAVPSSRRPPIFSSTCCRAACRWVYSSRRSRTVCTNSFSAPAC